MSITRSLTQSTLSTTGDTIYMDAESRASDFATPDSSIHAGEEQHPEVQETAEIATIGNETAQESGEPGRSSDSTATSTGAKEGEEDKADDKEVKAVVAKDEGSVEEGEPTKTDQPVPAAKPAYVRQRGHESSGSECNAFFCQNNCFEVLDIPNPSGWWSLICNTCCASCFAGGVNNAKTIR